MSEEQSGAVTQEAPTAEPVEVETEETNEGEASVETADSTDEGDSSETAEDAQAKEEPSAAQKRIQELANLRREAENRAKALEQRLAEIEQRFTTQQTEQVVDVNALNTHLGAMREKIDFLRIDGKHLEADMLEMERNTLITEYQQWQREDKERRERMTQQQQSQAEMKKALADFDHAVSFLGEQNGIPPEALQVMGQEFQDICQTDKVFARQIMETIRFQGPVAAALLAYDKVKAVQADKAAKLAAEKAAKESAKEKTVASTPGGSRDSTKLSDDLPIEEWIRRREKLLKQK